MSPIHRSLVVVLVVVAVTSAIVSLPGREARDVDQRAFLGLPVQIGGWTAQAWVVDRLFPTDRRGVESIERVYEKGERRLWLAIVRYSGASGADKRPALDALVPERTGATVSRDAVTVPLAPDGGVPATRVALITAAKTLTTWYWYHLGSRAIGDEYRLRFWLAVDSIVGRDQPLLLVRVATDDGVVPSDFIRAMAPHLQRLAAHSERH
jgi:hypothetical protein